MDRFGNSFNGESPGMNAGTLLHRQVHPSWVQEGRATSQVFKPTSKDEKCLSVYDGDQIDAEAAWRHYVETSGYNSIGILAVTVGECENLELTVAPDPDAFPEHVCIDFRGLAKRQIEKKAKTLNSKARSRGWQFCP